MPEYLAPGVFVEEVSFRAKAIEGVPTSTAGFVGACRYGPVIGAPLLVTSLAAFERLYGDGQPLAFAPNFLWHAARAFFDNGGSRLFVGRVFKPLDSDDGVARGSAGDLALAARHPGALGNLQLRLRLKLEPPGARLAEGDVVWVPSTPAPVAGPKDLPLALVQRGSDGQLHVDGVVPGAAVQTFSLGLEVLAADGRVLSTWSGLSANPARAQASLLGCFGADAEAGVPVRIPGEGLADGRALLHAMLSGPAFQLSPAELPAGGGDARASWRKKLEAGVTLPTTLTGGNDGLPPDTAACVEGLKAMEAADEVALVAAPGVGWRKGEGEAIAAALVAHAEHMRYRVALLDPPQGMSLGEVRVFRQGLQSSHAALYYPWVTVTDPLSGQPLNLPPSGFIAGICARVDTERGVWKAPANEAVRGALRFERDVTAGEQNVLNPEGINCLRAFPGRGLLVWGARTVSADPEWKYLNVRRYFARLERSLDVGTQWAVFEPNGEALWAQVRAAVEAFLHNDWRQGALQGSKAEDAFFVRCDRATMTQNDLDNGRLVALVGVAPVKPAEFVIFRIGQWTADANAA